MPFRCRQKFVLASNTPVEELELVTTPSGEVEMEVVDQSEKTMPDPELFDLKNQINAGIEQEEVNSAVLRASTVDANKVVRKYIKKTVKEDTANEG